MIARDQTNSEIRYSLKEARNSWYTWGEKNSIIIIFANEYFHFSPFSRLKILVRFTSYSKYFWTIIIIQGIWVSKLQNFNPALKRRKKKNKNWCTAMDSVTAKKLMVSLLASQQAYILKVDQTRLIQPVAIGKLFTKLSLLAYRI